MKTTNFRHITFLIFCFFCMLVPSLAIADAGGYSRYCTQQNIRVSVGKINFVKKGGTWADFKVARGTSLQGYPVSGLQNTRWQSSGVVRETIDYDNGLTLLNPTVRVSNGQRLWFDVYIGAGGVIDFGGNLKSANSNTFSMGLRVRNLSTGQTILDARGSHRGVKFWSRLHRRVTAPTAGVYRIIYYGAGGTGQMAMNLGSADYHTITRVSETRSKNVSWSWNKTRSRYQSANGATPSPATLTQVLNTGARRCANATLVDTDGDGIPDRTEAPVSSNPVDTDGDGTPDYQDKDSDNDGLLDSAEGTENRDGDTLPNYRDPDDDGDGILTKHEAPDANGDGNPTDARDTDNDGTPDYLDNDDDGDGNLTADETPDPDGNGNPSDAIDSDQDGTPNYLDNNDTPVVSVYLKAFLQGAYRPDTGLMRDDLRSAELIPTNQPYSMLKYNGTETVSADVLAVTGNDAAVDWVLVELRAVADRATRLAAKPAIVQRDGDIVDAATGQRELRFPNVQPGDYQIAISHRNHLGIVTETARALSATPQLIDFTLPDTAVYGANARWIYNDTAALWGGETDRSNSIIIAGPGNDPTNILTAILTDPGNTALNSNHNITGYHQTDTNMDGATRFAGPNNDVTLILSNVLSNPANLGSMSGNFILTGQQPVALLP